MAGIRPQRQQWLVRQAALQVEARLAGGAELPHELIEAGEDARLGHGFELMPLPDHGDVFLDFEGHPFWRPDTQLFFLDTTPKDETCAGNATTRKETLPTIYRS